MRQAVAESRRQLSRIRRKVTSRRRRHRFSSRARDKRVSFLKPPPPPAAKVARSSRRRSLCRPKPTILIQSIMRRRRWRRKRRQWRSRRIYGIMDFTGTMERGKERNIKKGSDENDEQPGLILFSPSPSSSLPPLFALPYMRKRGVRLLAPLFPRGRRPPLWVFFVTEERGRVVLVIPKVSRRHWNARFSRHGRDGFE